MPLADDEFAPFVVQSSVSIALSYSIYRLRPIADISVLPQNRYEADPAAAK